LSFDQVARRQNDGNVWKDLGINYGMFCHLRDLRRGLDVDVMEDSFSLLAAARSQQPANEKPERHNSRRRARRRGFKGMTKAAKSGTQSDENTQSTQTVSNRVANIASLPTELIIQIFRYLKPVPAAVLSLTCKRLYYIRKQTWPTIVRLTQQSDGHKLYLLLKKWMGNDLVFAAPYKKFVSVGLWARVLEERRTTNKILRETEAIEEQSRQKRRLLDQRRIERKRALTTARRGALVRRLWKARLSGSM
jgi:hypothetical protein